MASDIYRSKKWAGAMCTRYLSVLLLALLFLVGSVVAQPIPVVGNRVWAQWTPNAWFPGTVAKTVDMGLHIEFDDGDKADRPVSLVTADRVPQADHVKVGTRVLARSEDDRLYPATVTSLVKDRFEVRYDDQATRTVGLDDLRIMAVRLKPELTAKPGDRVWAQWSPNNWFPGKAERAADMGLHIEFDDGEKADLPVSLVAPDRNPAENAVVIGSRVLAQWHDNRYYPGAVTSIVNQRYDIAFDDGDARKGLPLEQIRLINE